MTNGHQTNEPVTYIMIPPKDDELDSADQMKRPQEFHKSTESEDDEFHGQGSLNRH